MLDGDRLKALDAGLRAAGAGMSIPLLRTLIGVAVNPNVSSSALADLIGIPQQSANRYVAILQGRYRASMISFEGRPLLSQTLKSEDRRCYELVLTSRGAAWLERVVNEMFAR